MRHGQTNYSGGPSTPARAPSWFAARQDDMSRNMARYPMVLKDYGFPSKFARRFRYNGQALVYSELLALNAAFAI